MLNDMFLQLNRPLDLHGRVIIDYCLHVCFENSLFVLFNFSSVFFLLEIAEVAEGSLNQAS